MIACATLLALSNLARNRQAPMSIDGTIPSIKLIRLGHYSPISDPQAEHHTSPVRKRVIGEHGTASVSLWFSARIADNSVEALIDRSIKRPIEQDVRYANITIIEGIGASQYGNGIVSARLAEAVLRDEKGCSSSVEHQAALGVSVSLPSVIGAAGVERVLMPQLSGEEQAALHTSAQHIADATARLR